MLPGLLLRWLSDPEAFKQRRSDAEWKAFCEQCKTDFRFDPVKEGPLKAAQPVGRARQPLGARSGSVLPRHRPIIPALWNG